MVWVSRVRSNRILSLNSYDSDPRKRSKTPVDMHEVVSKKPSDGKNDDVSIRIRDVDNLIDTFIHSPFDIICESR